MDQETAWVCLAAKSGPTAIRGQYYGIAAAVGKVGRVRRYLGLPRHHHSASPHTSLIRLIPHSVFFLLLPLDFGGANTNKGNTGPFWIGSGLAILSAIITFFFIRPLSADSMTKEDADFRAYLEENGFDTSQMGSGEDLDDRESVGTDEKADYAAKKVDSDGA